jgi:hypothetical protein
MPILVPFIPSTPAPPTFTVNSPQFRLQFIDGPTAVNITTVESASTQIGRQSARTDGAGAGSATITIDDTARILDADNTASPLYGHLTPGGTTTVQLLVYNTSVYTPVFTGLIESIGTTYSNGAYIQATVQLVDATRDLNNHIPAQGVTYPKQQTGARIGQMLGAPSRSGWGWINRAPSAAFALDAGQKVLEPLVCDGSPTTEVWIEPSLAFNLPNDRVIADVAYVSGDGFTAGYGPHGAFSWANSTTQVITNNAATQDTQLADIYQTAARARWEYEHYSVNRRDATTVEINTQADWGTTGATSRFSAGVGVKLSDYVALNMRPATGATIAKRYWVDAIAHSITANSWSTTFTLLAADTIATTWRLGVDRLQDIQALQW